MKIEDYEKIDNISNDSMFPIETIGDEGTKKATIKDIYDFFNGTSFKSLVAVSNKIDGSECKYAQCGKIVAVALDFHVKSGQVITGSETLFSGLPLLPMGVYFLIHKYTTSESRRIHISGDGTIKNLYENIEGGYTYSGTVTVIAK